jgi:glutaredoxin 2
MRQSSLVPTLLALALMLTLATPLTAFQPTSPNGARVVSSVSGAPSASRPLFSASSTDSATAFDKPPRVVRPVLPTLWVYDHCPFCVRVRVALGLKNVKFDLRFLANDDIATPTALIGKKMAPIFEWKEKPGVKPMAESLDIIALADSDERLGPTGVLLPATDRTDLKAWQGGIRDLLRNLQRPRYVATGLMPEFQQLDGRHAFVANHPLPGYEKAQWKEDVPMDEKLSLYAQVMAQDPAADVEELNRKLVELDDLLYSADHCSPGGMSYDDIDLFSRLRSITIVQGVVWPTKLRQYMDSMSALSDVPLYDEMAL